MRPPFVSVPHNPSIAHVNIGAPCVCATLNVCPFATGVKSEASRWAGSDAAVEVKPIEANGISMGDCAWPVLQIAHAGSRSPHFDGPSAGPYAHSVPRTLLVR